MAVKVNVRVQRRYIRLVDVLKMVPMSKSSIYAKIAKNEFPKQRNISERIVVWDRREINAFLKGTWVPANDAGLKVA